MDDAQLVAECDANLYARYRRLSKRGEVVERNGLLVAAGRPAYNVAFVTEPQTDPEAALSGLGEYFEAHEGGFTLRIREGLDPATAATAEAQGFARVASEPGMVLTGLDGLPDALDGLEIRPEGPSARGREELAATLAGGFGSPLAFTRWLTATETQGHPENRFYVGYVDGEPVATSQLVRTGATAGIYGVSTVPSHRGRGIGEAMTWHVIREGVQAGCTLATLQTSEIAESIYRRMGFRTVASYPSYRLAGDSTG